MQRCLVLALLTVVYFNSYGQPPLRQWWPGSYFTLKGQKADGLLYFTSHGNTLFSDTGENVLHFKVSKEAEERQIKASMLRGFSVVTGTARRDSFTIGHQIDSNNISHSYDFLMVVVDRNPVKLYRYFTYIQSASPNKLNQLLTLTHPSPAIYYYGSAAGKVVMINPRNYRAALTSVLADDPPLVAQIQHGDFHPWSIDKILSLYQEDLKKMQ